MAAAARELPTLNRLLYASGSLGGNALSRSRDLWLIFFYAPPPDADTPERIPILVLGALLAAARVVEALDDPLIGWWSDRTRSRWGRRIPFVVLATPPLAIFAVLIWIPPQGHEGFANAIYFFVILEAYHLFGTLSGGPFESLLPEIAPGARSRVSVVTWQVFFGTIGTFMALVVSGIIIDVWGFAVMGAVMAALALSSRYLALGGVWRYVRRDVEPATLDLRGAIRATLANDQFRSFLPSFVFFNMAISLMTASLPFWVSAVLLKGFPPDVAGLESGASATLQVFALELDVGVGTIVGVLTGAAILVVLLTLPFVYRLALRRGKAWVYSQAMLMAAVCLPLLAFMGFIPGVNDLLQAVLLVGLVGVPMTAVFTFPNAIQADIIDYDALRTGERREAIYYGTQSTLEKIAGSLFPLILAALLLLGSSADNPLGIRLVGPVAGLCSLIGYVTFRAYRLPDEVTAESVAGLAPRRVKGPKESV